MIHYSQGVNIAQPVQIAHYKIKDGVPKHDKYSFVFRVSNNIHQIPCLESAELQEEWTEEEKIPVKKDIPAPKKAEPKPEAKSDAPD